MRCSRPKAVGRRSLAGDQLRAILGAIAIYRTRSCALRTIITYQPTLPASRLAPTPPRFRQLRISENDA
jgi:hypothetical protein